MKADKENARWTVNKGVFYATMGVLKATFFLVSKIRTTSLRTNLFAHSTSSEIIFLNFSVGISFALYFHFNCDDVNETKMTSLRITTMAQAVVSEYSDPAPRVSAAGYFSVL